MKERTKKQLKKMAAVMLCFALIFTVSSCGTGSGNSASSGSGTVSSASKSASSAAKKKKTTKKSSASKSDSSSKSSSSKSSGSSTSTHYCTIKITCHELVQHKDKLSSSQAERVPSDGVILGTTKMKIHDGDSVLDILLRVTKSKGIQTSYQGHTSYGTAYVEAIDNFYEKDAGDRSGWMYSVNGAFPKKGCSKYKVRSGDRILWEYTLKLGDDL